MAKRGRYGAKQEKPRRGGLLHIVLCAVTFLAAISLALMLLAPVVKPSVWWGFPVLGLAAPAIYIGNVAIVLFWIWQWQWRIALPTIILLTLGAGNWER